MKKNVCLLLAAVQMLLCLTGCSGSWPSESTDPTEPVDTIVYAYPSELPTYADNKEMPMIAFWSPPNTEEWYQSMVDCGFTDVIIDAKYNVTHGSSKLFDVLAICDKIGLGAYLAVNCGVSFTALKQYANYESFKGINTDEPNSKMDIDKIEKNMEKLYSAYPDKNVSYLTNFMPSLTSNLQKDFISYEAYVRYYMEHGGSDENAFMMDTYPLMTDGTIAGNWLQRLEFLAGISKEYGVDFYSYLATMSITGAGWKCRRPEEDDMRYTSYVNLAYGVKGLGYFCYMTPGLPPYNREFTPDDWALVNFEDADDLSTYYKTPTWDAVQTVNNELKAMDHVFLSFDWQGVMKSIGTDATTTAGRNCFTEAKNWIRKHDGIKKFTSTEDAILGVFKDENGYDGFMLVNFADTYYDKENTVTLELRGATRAVVYIQGQPQIVDLVNGTYTTTLQPGEGQFIIPLS